MMARSALGCQLSNHLYPSTRTRWYYSRLLTSSDYANRASLGPRCRESAAGLRPESPTHAWQKPHLIWSAVGCAIKSAPARCMVSRFSMRSVIFHGLQRGRCVDF